MRKGVTCFGSRGPAIVAPGRGWASWYNTGGSFVIAVERGRHATAVGRTYRMRCDHATQRKLDGEQASNSTMSHKASVSVIIPTWNRAATVVAAVESALAQTHAPLEVLVCDDGSTDDSAQRIRAMSDPRVRWLPGPRGGRPAFPRNRGIAAARGEWLAFLDSDDEWLPVKLERQLASVRIRGRLASCTNAWRVFPGVDLRERMLSSPDGGVGLTDLLGGNGVICSSAFIHRSLLRDIEGFPEATILKALEDYALWLRVACFSEFDHLSEPLVLYRDEPVASVRADGLDARTQRVEVMADFIAWCRRHAGPHTREGLRVARRYRDKHRLWRDGEVPAVHRLRRWLGRVRRGLRGGDGPSLS
jgi:glycosyltransferase involved in cell wall biosynthesis